MPIPTIEDLRENVAVLRDMLERAESSSAYEAAQDRWKQREADDTLDLY